MQFPRYFVYIACVASCVVSIGVGALMYFTLKPHPNVLGASTSVTILDKKYFEQISTSKFKYYYEMKPSVTVLGTAHWLRKKIEYSINADGIHSKKDFAVSAPKDTFRIIVLGDSFTFGQFVNTEENYPSRLLESLQTLHCAEWKNIEIINLGVQGYDIGYTVEHFVRLGQKYQPDLIIWLVNTHNLVPLDQRNDRFNEIVATLSEEEKASLNNGVDSMLYFAQAAQEVVRTLGKDIIAQMLQKNIHMFTEHYAGQLVVFINDTMNDADFVQYLRASFMERPLTHVANSFPNLSRVNGLHPDKHPNSMGHITIASYMYEELMAKKIISCTEQL